MTQEQYERAKPLEGILKSAVNSNYIRLMDRQTTTLFASLCNELQIHINMNCPVCTLNAAIKLGKIYMSYIPRKKRDDIQDTLPTEDDKTITTTPPVQPASPDPSVQVSEQKAKSEQNDTSEQNDIGEQNGKSKDVKPKKQVKKKSK